MPMKVVTVTIREVPGRGWLWKERGRYYKTAGGAYNAVLRDGKRFSQTVAHVITWEPETEVGSMVVKALA